MKRTILIISLLQIMYFGNSFSQSLTISKSGKLKLNGDTVQFWGDTGTVQAFKIVPKNISKDSINIKCKKLVLYAKSATTNTFCFGGSCYNSTTIISPNSAPLGAGDTVTTLYGFNGDYYPSGKTDSCVVRYTFFNVINPNDSIALSVIYRVRSFNSIDSKSFSELGYITAYPNPSDKYSIINYHFNKEFSRSKIIVRDLYGREVYSMNIVGTQGMLTIPTSSLNDGFYICSILADDNVISKMIVVKH